MRHPLRRRLRQFVVLGCLVGVLANLSGCAPTTVRSVWKLEDFEGSYAKILVAAQFPDSGMRTRVEEAAVADLTGRGVEAVAGGVLLSEHEILNRGEIFSVMADGGYDGALVVYYVGTKTLTTFFGKIPGATGRDDSYVEYTKAAVEVVIVEADFYDAATKLRVWFIVTETPVEEDLFSEEKAFSSLIDALGDSLAGKHLLAR